MNKFVDTFNNESKWTKTENNADALNTTSSALLDLFGQIGALRSREEINIESLFGSAMRDDKLLATKMSFYSRNIRGGLGEKRTSRIMWRYLAKKYPEIMKKNIHLVPKFGRWDDLYTFVGTPCELSAFYLIGKQLRDDLLAMKTGKPASLLAKWLKSVNTSSKLSRELGKLTAKRLELSVPTYRKVLSKLRNYLKVTEVAMCNREFGAIDYKTVPSNAMTRYYKAFYKRDAERFNAFMEKVKKGEVKIHSDTLYPYDIVEKIMYRRENSDVLEEQWKALPNYVEGEHSFLVMADVSGSMSGRPMATSVGLAIYFAERNKGAFHNLFMTFSGNPQFVSLRGDTLHQKIYNVAKANWQMNTNIEKAFEAILNLALDNNVPVEDMPTALVIISDMQFDLATNSDRMTYYSSTNRKFESAGYVMPKLVFWNVDARRDTFHGNIEDYVQFISGQSASAFKSLIEGKNLSAYELMVQTLNDDMYSEVTI